MKNASFPLEVVDIILPLLNLTEIAKLSAASKTLGSSVCDVLANSRPLELLVQGLEQTYSHMKGLLDGRSPLHRLWAVVGFLLDSRKIQCGPNIAATPGLTENLRQWFTVPCVPYTMACPFVELGGLRMSYQQLLALARSRTLGLEVWVLVQKKLRIQSDIPDAVVNICCPILDQKVVNGKNGDCLLAAAWFGCGTADQVCIHVTCKFQCLLCCWHCFNWTHHSIETCHHHCSIMVALLASTLHMHEG